MIKLTLLTSDQNFRRKVQEAYLALQLEDAISKEEILEEYLNVIYLGGSSYGVCIAAQDYFGKDLEQLTLRECATLAGMIRNPSRYNPRSNYYSRNTPEVTDDRADYVLELMYEQGYITEDEYQHAMNEQLTVLEKGTAASNEMYDNAYYVEYAIYDVVTKMLRVEGDLEDNSTNRAAMQRQLRTGGYRVYTSLDPAVQEAAQQVITEWDDYPGMRYSNDRTTRASLGGGEYLTVVQPQAAAAVMNYHTGELVAIVGGREEPVQKLQFNRAYQNNMPIGSSIKPLSVYGPAFDLGNSPGTPVLNLPIPILNWQSENGYPNNYGGGDFTGTETMRYAMNRSHNTAAAQGLMTYVGIENSVGLPFAAGRGSRPHQRQRLRPGAGQLLALGDRTGGGLRRGGQPRRIPRALRLHAHRELGRLHLHRHRPGATQAPSVQGIHGLDAGGRAQGLRHLRRGYRLASQLPRHGGSPARPAPTPTTSASPSRA